MNAAAEPCKLCAAKAAEDRAAGKEVTAPGVKVLIGSTWWCETCDGPVALENARRQVAS